MKDLRIYTYIEGDIITVKNDYKTIKFNIVENSTFQLYFRVGNAGRVIQIKDWLLINYI